MVYGEALVLVVVEVLLQVAVAAEHGGFPCCKGIGQVRVLVVPMIGVRISIFPRCPR